MQFSDTINPVKKDQWQALATRFLDNNYQQAWEYSHALAEMRSAKCEHVAIQSGEELIGLANIRIRSLPVIGGGIAYISGGPLTRFGNDDDVKRLEKCLKALQSEYVDKRGLALRILAPIGSPDWNEQATNVFEEAGFNTSDRTRSYRTFLLDINRSLGDIRATCSKYWRRNLRRAETKGFEITKGETSEHFRTVCCLYEQLLGRKKFSAELNAEFYADLQTQLTGDDRFIAFTVNHEGDAVAGLICSMIGNTCVPLILAADEEGLRNYAVYLLQWHSIEMAHERGQCYYDLGGIDPDKNVGVYNFKKGLRGLDVQAPGPFESSPSDIRYAIMRQAEDFYRRLKRAA
ncbi:MAG: peptidoglycan bridge formation glycyltransferase FemA/FemB family protein [Planctomycetes bacterium]|nr:peptidoglycan bridge formation glycyltransferase FemA/FemB family protein [Planctomycetota bacterium]